MPEVICPQCRRSIPYAAHGEWPAQCPFCHRDFGGFSPPQSLIPQQSRYSSNVGPVLEVPPTIIIDNRPKSTKRPAASEWLFGSLGASFGLTSGCLLALIVIPSLFMLIAGAIFAVHQSIAHSQAVQLHEAEERAVRKKYSETVITALKAYGGLVPKTVATDPPLICELSNSGVCDKELSGRCVDHESSAVDFRIGIRETRVTQKNSIITQIEPVFVVVDGVLVWGVRVQ